MICCFYNPDIEGRAGLAGNFIIMDHIMRARDGLPYVYLG
jgi:arginine-tRNA-protein transferase